MTPDEPNLVDLLLRKADQDLYVLDKAAMLTAIRSLQSWVQTNLPKSK